MKKGRILTALCAALMCLFMLGGCAGCDGEGGGGKTEVDLMKEVIAENCDYYYHVAMGAEGQGKTSEFVAGTAKELIYTGIGFYTLTDETFEISSLSYKIYSKWQYQMQVDLLIHDVEDNHKSLYYNSKEIDCSTLTETERQQGKEVSWSFDKVSVKGGRSSKPVISLRFSFYKDGEEILFSRLEDGLYETLFFKIGSLAMK